MSALRAELKHRIGSLNSISEPKMADYLDLVRFFGTVADVVPLMPTTNFGTARH